MLSSASAAGEVRELVVPAGFRKVIVGGHPFVAHVDNLRKIPFFAAMLDRFTDSDLVADRDPEAFRYILNHVRDASYGVPYKYAVEVAFYGLSDTILESTEVADGSWLGLLERHDALTPAKGYSGNVKLTYKPHNTMLFIYHEYVGHPAKVESITLTHNFCNARRLRKEYIEMANAVVPAHIRESMAEYTSGTNMKAVFLPWVDDNYNEAAIDMTTSIHSSEIVQTRVHIALTDAHGNGRDVPVVGFYDYSTMAFTIPASNTFTQLQMLTHRVKNCPLPIFRYTDEFKKCLESESSAPSCYGQIFMLVYTK